MGKELCVEQLTRAACSHPPAPLAKGPKKRASQVASPPASKKRKLDELFRRAVAFPAGKAATKALEDIYEEGQIV